MATKTQEVEYRTIHRPIIQFATPDGHHVQYQEVVAAPEGFRIGDAVTVHYDPRNPRLSATISEAGRALTMVAATGAMTLLMAGMVVVGVLMLIGIVPPAHF